MPEAEPQKKPPVRWPMTIGLIVFSALFRLLPHRPPNLTPLGAFGVFSGGRVWSWFAYAAPVIALAVSDMLLWLMWGYKPFNFFVYLSIVLNVLIGRWLLKTESPWKIGGASLAASLQFFLLTNLGVWLAGHLYPLSMAGFVSCYVQALPYFGYTVIGDLGFCGAMFGLHAWLSRTYFAEEVEASRATT